MSRIIQLFTGAPFSRHAQQVLGRIQNRFYTKLSGLKGRFERQSEHRQQVFDQWLDHQQRRFEVQQSKWLTHGITEERLSRRIGRHQSRMALLCARFDEEMTVEADHFAKRLAHSKRNFEAYMAGVHGRVSGSMPFRKVVADFTGVAKHKL
ncbi:MAG: hypothetical protein KTR14_00685 [Vampirovibrio sp.]|nr:hypothetical protein [Vampirovibrio sp.]